jgi:hypothetical protein
VIATDNLRHLHDRLRTGLTLVAELEEQLRAHQGEAAKLESFDRVVDYLHGSVIPHLRGELAVLYPESDLLRGIDHRLVRQLIDNCEQLKCYADRIVHDRDRLRRGACDNVGCRHHIAALVRLLRRHLEGVEELLLPQLGARLNDDAVQAIYERIEEAQFEAAIELRQLTAGAG